MAIGTSFSIVRRMTVLVIAISLVSLVLHVFMAFNFGRPMMQELIDHLASETRLVRSVLRRSVPEDRYKVAQALSLPRMEVSRQPPPDALPRLPWQELDMPGEMLDALVRQLGPDIEIVEEPPARDGASRVVHIGVLVDGETWWVHHRLPARSASWAIFPLLIPVLLVVLAGTLASVMGIRLITRPMSLLSKEMLSRRKQLSPIEPAQPVGAELNTMVNAFNEMVLALRRSDQSRRNLLAGVSHDLRTPLARLRLRAELECPDAVFQAMEADFKAVAHIIEQFLAYAQGHGPQESGPKEAMADVMRRSVSRYAEAGLSVELGRIDQTSLMVSSTSLQRLLGNLIDNALSHGQPPVVVALEVRESAWVELVVYDQGVGISADAFGQALMPFVKLGRLNDEVGHCGLGLAIVSQIASMLGAEVRLHPFDGHRSGIGVRWPV
ncbi:sensor histidine kinase [Aquabacterium sp.]|uniref:sensor histidine kinase n=1 Tax=Aquabacterium sp. TaxID=1872578 RepID=UPI0035B104C1